MRQNPKLQKQVKKDFSELGLKVISLKNESSSSESESSQTSSTSDSELSKKKKKKNISLRKIRPLLKPHLMMIVILRRRKSITLRKHNHCPHVENMHILLCAHLINIFSFLRGDELRHFFHSKCLRVHNDCSDIEDVHLLFRANCMIISHFWGVLNLDIFYIQNVHLLLCAHLIIFLGVLN